MGEGPSTQLRALARIRAAEVLPSAARARKKVSVTDATTADREAKRLGDVLLADKFLEQLGTVAARHDDVIVRHFPSTFVGIHHVGSQIGSTSRAQRKATAVPAMESMVRTQ